MGMTFLLTPLLALVGLVGFAVITADPNQISVDPINPSGFLAYNGYAPATLSTMFIGELSAIQAYANTSRGSAYQSEDKVKSKTVEAMSDSLQIGKPLKVIQLTLGLIPLQVGGAIVDKGKELQIQLTGYSSDSKIYKVKKTVPSDGSVETLVREGALGLLEQLDPYLVANYYFKQERKSKDFTNTRRLIHQGILQGKPEELPWFYNLYGRMLHVEGKYEEAIAQYQASFKLDAKFPRSHLHWGRALVELKRYDEAWQQFNEALRLDPGYADAWVEKAALLTAKEEPVKAMQAYAKALALDPRHAYAYAKWGELLLARGRTADGIEALRRAIFIDPKDSGFQATLAKALGKEDPVFKGLDDARAAAAAAGGYGAKGK